jgi:hypothetical protein
MTLVEKQYIDERGIARFVLLPDDEADIQSGIPVSLDLEPLFGHMPLDFQRRLYEALHDQGLIKPEDYMKPDAYSKFRAAMLSVIRHDFFSVQSLVKESIHERK